ncbi:MAG: DUF4407 domain-containing protein [Bacteroidota bacterium]
MKRIILHISNLFIFCSGAKQSILVNCPDERSKYAGMGATVLFTGLLAMLSGGYAFSQVFYDHPYVLPISLVFALFWGLIIFNLDRLIIMNIRKEGSIWKELSVASGRIVLAIFIAIVISKPLEVKLFEDRISTLIESAQFAQDSIDFKRTNETYGIDERNANYKASQDKIASLRDRLTNEAPTNPRYREIKDQELPQKEQAYATANKNYYYYREELLKVYRPHGAKLYKELPDEVKPDADPYRYNMGLHDRSRKKIKQEIGKLKAELEQLRQEHRNLITENIKDSEGQLEKEKEEKESIEAIANKGLANIRAANAKSYSENLITQLEFLHKLTENREGNEVMHYIGLFITLLFLSLELSPVLVKIFTKPGAYDALLSAQELRMASAANTIANAQHKVDIDKVNMKKDLAVQAINKWGIQKRNEISSKTLTKQETEQYIKDIGLMTA